MRTRGLGKRRMNALRWLPMVAGLWLAMLAPAAHAGLSNWTSLSGLTANSGSSWVRLFQTGTPPTTIYAGTEQDGVFKSINDGLTWAPCNTGLSSDHLSIFTIYTSGSKVWVGTDDGLYSAPDTVSSSCSWTPVAQGPPPDPENPTNLPGPVQAVISVTGGPMLAGSGGSGVYRSTDGGQTWHAPPEGNGMPDDATIWQFASFANFVWAATSDGIFRSSDQGATWSESDDGIPFDVTLGIFQDTQNPLIYYAETGSSGLYRSVDGGTTWQSVNGDPGGEQFGGSQTPIIRQIVEKSGATQTRLYVATSDGLWVGTLPNVVIPGTGGKSAEVPGQITWRQATTDGLGNNVIIWGLSSFTSVPGTLLAGTQSNGGYSLTFQPPVNDGQPADLPSWLAASLVKTTVGTQLIGTTGTWSGTQQIDYAYQWQRCTSTQTSTCSDISGATDRNYTLTTDDQSHYVRLKVTASNDFPTFGPLASAYSTISTIVAHNPLPLPGSNQESAPEIVDPTVHDFSEPWEGDTLTAPAQSAENPSGWFFNPAATTIEYQWQRCDANGNSCASIPGATGSTYKLTFADNEQTIRVVVTGASDDGATVLPVSAAFGPIIPLAATELTPPKLLGNAVVGSTLVGTVGSWASPATTWTRQWMQCEPDGSDCTPISGATSPDYTVTNDDYGMTLEEEVTAAVGPAGQLPLPVVVDTPVSAVVTEPAGVAPPAMIPPVVTPPAVTPPIITALPTPPVKSTPPPVKAETIALAAVNGLALRQSHGHTSLTFVLSQSGRAIVALQRVTAGHRVKHRCVKGTRRHAAACTIDTTVLKITRVAAHPGRQSVPLPTKVRGRALPTGRYRLLVTPVSTAGRSGVPRVLNVSITRR